jgi:hypothetical protein
MTLIRLSALLLLLVTSGCATLGGLAQLQPPRISAAAGYDPEIRLLAPSVQRPAGGATVRLWASIENPNPIGVVLSTLQGNLALEGIHAADVSFPLGLPLAAVRDTVVPLDISVSFSELPRLAEIVPRVMAQGTIAYQLDGTVGVDAGLLGQPTFGPMRLMDGTIQARR